MQNGNGQSLVVTPTLGSYATSLAGPVTARRLDQTELASWIRDWADPSQGKKQCVCFALSHEDRIRGRTSITHRAILNGKKATAAERDAFVDKIVAEFDLLSWNFVAGGAYPDTQRFFVSATVRDDPDDHALVEYPFAVTPPPEAMQNFQRDEDTNLPAIVGHFQRLLDRSFGLMASNMQADKDRLVQEKQDLMNHNKELMNQRWDMAVKCEELLDQRSMRAVKEHEARMRLDLEYSIYKGLSTYGVAFLKRLAEGKSSGDVPTADAVAQKIAKVVKPEQLIGFIGMLDDDQQAELKPMMQSIAEAFTDDKKKRLAEVLLSQGVKPEGQK